MLVIPLHLYSQTHHRVQPWIDRAIWQQERFLCRPLVNTATLVLARSWLEHFFEFSGHSIHLIDM